MNELTCQSCRHWHAAPPDPANLTAPPRGQCRGAPPTATAIPMQGGGLSFVCVYPVLEAGTAACGLHSPPPAAAPKTVVLG